MLLSWGSLLRGFFSPVSAEASQEIFKIASMAPGALLLEAQKEYEVRPAVPAAPRRLGELQCKPLPALSRGNGNGGILGACKIDSEGLVGQDEG